MGDGRSYVIFCVLRWGMGHMLVSGIIGGEDRSLKQYFPVMFSIVRNKDAMVVDNLVNHNGVIQWNVLFTRQIHD
jgi:hypothetical protein